MIGLVSLLSNFIGSCQRSVKKERESLITYSLSKVLSQHVLVLDVHLFIYLILKINTFKEFSSRQEHCLAFAKVRQVYLYFQMTGAVWPGAHAKVIQCCYCY